jgi:serine/threonine-protein kinase
MTNLGEQAVASRYAEGTVIGDKYQLVRRLDEGGMGEVWVVHHTELDVHLAVKLVRHELATADAARRLLEEARIVARLSHPAIVRVTDVGRTEARDPFIVMELLHGECLADRLYRCGPLTEVEAVRMLLPAADALAQAHESGVVHRDLKPDNIFLAEFSGSRLQPKVIDFGIALSDREASARLTGAGAVVGSPGYMSPEQARGLSDVDARCDVWSLCVVLYEAISGSTPFGDEGYNATLRAIVEREPVPLTGLVDCDPAFWAIVRRGLRKAPADRWPSMRELGLELARWLRARGVTDDVTRASLHAIWPEADAAGSVPPIALTRSSRPPSGSEAPQRSHQLTTNGHSAMAMAPPAAARSRWSIAAVLFGVALGAGALALHGALRTRPVPAAPAAAPLVAAPPTPIIAPPAAPRAEPSVDPVRASEPSVEPAPAPAADAGPPPTKAPRRERARRARPTDDGSSDLKFRPRKL